MTKKKISQVPTESMTQTIADYTDCYLSEVAQLDFTIMHFFDESSVIVTSGNRNYGTSYKGEPAAEIQRYASNANFTLNLLNSAQMGWRCSIVLMKLYRSMDHMEVLFLNLETWL
jgi:hypothetical protein